MPRRGEAELSVEAGNRSGVEELSHARKMVIWENELTREKQ